MAEGPQVFRVPHPSIRPRLRSRGDSVRDGGPGEGEVSFNSATAAEPWRLSQRLLLGASSLGPSIRPRLRSRGDSSWVNTMPHNTSCLQFGHGCGAVEIASAAYWIASQAGPSIRPRLRSRGDSRHLPRIAEPVRGPSIRPRLRSRGDSPPGPPSLPARGASIRPRLRSRGDWVGEAPGVTGGRGLQFGHGCGAVEILATRRAPSGREGCFNSATAAEPWRLPALRWGGKGVRLASIRPRLRSRGDAVRTPLT